MYVGIDPGITGALVLIDEDGRFKQGWRTPMLQSGARSKKQYDVANMANLLRHHREVIHTVCIERVAVMPHDGKVGAFNFGKGYGIWVGILAALRIPYMEVTPQRWQSEMLKGLPRGPHTKTSAVQRCNALFPELELKVKADWGKADAALIAEYVRLNRDPRKLNR